MMMKNGTKKQREALSFLKNISFSGPTPTSSSSGNSGNSNSHGKHDFTQPNNTKRTHYSTKSHYNTTHLAPPVASIVSITGAQIGAGGGDSEVFSGDAGGGDALSGSIPSPSAAHVCSDDKHNTVLAEGSTVTSYSSTTTHNLHYGHSNNNHNATTSGSSSLSKANPTPTPSSSSLLKRNSNLAIKIPERQPSETTPTIIHPAAVTVHDCDVQQKCNSSNTNHPTTKSKTAILTTNNSDSTTKKSDASNSTEARKRSAREQQKAHKNRVAVNFLSNIQLEAPTTQQKQHSPPHKHQQNRPLNATTTATVTTTESNDESTKNVVILRHSEIEQNSNPTPQANKSPHNDINSPITSAVMSTQQQPLVGSQQRDGFGSVKKRVVAKPGPTNIIRQIKDAFTGGPSDTKKTIYFSAKKASAPFMVTTYIRSNYNSNNNGSSNNGSNAVNASPELVHRPSPQESPRDWELAGDYSNATKKGVSYSSMLESLEHSNSPTNNLDGTIAYQLQQNTIAAESDPTHAFDATQKQQINGDIGDNISGGEVHSATNLAMLRSPNYDPYYLDDPLMRAGKHRKIMQFPYILSSTIPFVRNKERKAELNEQFRQRHPYVHPSLTLSKIRNLKKLCVEEYLIDSPQLMDLATVALAHIYFEKLVLYHQHTVRKENRKLYMATCLLLAIKFSFAAPTQRSFDNHLDSLSDVFGVSRKKILESEFKVFALLEFNLDVPKTQLYPHMKRLVHPLKHTVQEHLGEKAFNTYFPMGAPVDKHHDLFC